MNKLNSGISGIFLPWEMAQLSPLSACAIEVLFFFGVRLLKEFTGDKNGTFLRSHTYNSAECGRWMCRSRNLYSNTGQHCVRTLTMCNGFNKCWFANYESLPRIFVTRTISENNSRILIYSWIFNVCSSMKKNQVESQKKSLKLQLCSTKTINLNFSLKCLKSYSFSNWWAFYS